VTTLDTTRRDLVVLRGFVYVPVTWNQVMAQDNFLAPGGMSWHVRAVEREADDVIVHAVCGALEATVRKQRDEPVHVLEPSTGARLAEHLGGTPAVRDRRTKGEAT